MSFAAAQATYVLHSRPYKETSALVDFFTPLGRLSRIVAMSFCEPRSCSALLSS
ncbi:recombination protein O N-terminal domain-containing protein [Pseudomonas aeruginosa]|nr:recombination protein O N-terminal domain-containing protein [Pseudomonas aeruginosa]MDE9399409.1 recombination protein O N-terminal domain-containing protein [Pseudomonas aeruginosa]